MAAKGTSSFLELKSTASVAEAVALMHRKKSGCVIVSFDGSYGLFTERDYLSRVAVYDEFEPAEIKLGDVCTPSNQMKSVAPANRATDCLALMVGGNFRHVPVIEKKQLVGLISMPDITRFFLH